MWNGEQDGVASGTTDKISVYLTNKFIILLQFGHS